MGRKKKSQAISISLLCHFLLIVTNAVNEDTFYSAGPHLTSQDNIIGQINVYEDIEISLDVIFSNDYTYTGNVPWLPIFGMLDQARSELWHTRWAVLFVSNVGFLFEYKAITNETQWYPHGYGGQEYSTTIPVAGNTYNIKLVTKGSSYKLYINNQLEIQRNDAPWATIPTYPLDVRVMDDLEPTYNLEIRNINVATSGKNLQDITFDYQTNEDFNGVPMNIGWLKFFHCSESVGVSSLPIYHNGYTLSELVTLSKYAITVKFLSGADIPGTNENDAYALKTDICSEQIFALNNGYALTYTLDHNTLLTSGASDINGWIGTTTAKDRISNAWCTQGAADKLLDQYFFHACGNLNGIHVVPYQTIWNKRGCQWDFNDATYHNFSMYLGYDIDKIKWCEINAADNYALLTLNPTSDPTYNPSLSPTDNPTNPTAYPTKYPTDSPTKFPTEYPTKSPTYNPTKSPTDYPTKNPTTPSPTYTDSLFCGDQITGAYNDKLILFYVQMTYYGDLTFDVSNSNVTVSYIEAFDIYNVSLAINSINQQSLTLINISPANYVFKFSANQGIFGTFDARVYCQSDNPTHSPTNEPTFEPTIHPTMIPTYEPTFYPTVIPTNNPTNNPTIFPSIFP
eukprot:181149_1